MRHVHAHPCRRRTAMLTLAALGALGLACCGAWAAETATAPPLLLPAQVCCATDYARRLVVDTAALDARTLTMAVAPAAMFTATASAPDPRHLEIRLRATTLGHGELTLRDAAQAVVGHALVQVVAVHTNSSRYIASEGSLPDGSIIFGGELILAPYVAGLEVRFISVHREVTVPDGLGERWTASETFVRVPSTGNGQLGFRMVMPARSKWVPYTYVVYQDGEQVSAP